MRACRSIGAEARLLLDRWCHLLDRCRWMSYPASVGSAVSRPTLDRHGPDRGTPRTGARGGSTFATHDGGDCDLSHPAVDTAWILGSGGGSPFHSTSHRQ